MLFVEEHGRTVVLDAILDGPVSLRAVVPGGVLGDIIRRRLHVWADESATVSLEQFQRHGRKLRVGDGDTFVTLDLAA